MEKEEMLKWIQLYGEYKVSQSFYTVINPERSEIFRQEADSVLNLIKQHLNK